MLQEGQAVESWVEDNAVVVTPGSDRCAVVAMVSAAKTALTKRRRHHESRGCGGDGRSGGVVRTKSELGRSRVRFEIGSGVEELETIGGFDS